ncbi:MAG: type II secretion system F family protein [Candidatus Diapherotrites archaeon]
MRVRFMLFSIEQSKKLSRRLIFIGRSLSRLFHGLKYDLPKAGFDIEAAPYLTAAFFSAAIYGVLFTLFIVALMFWRSFLPGGVPLLNEDFMFASLVGFLFFCIALILHAIYPGIISKNIASNIDRSLVFALKSMRIQVSSGVSLFDAMANIAKSNYGAISKEMGHVVKEIRSGMSEADAIEKLALSSNSDYLKKTSWQLLTSLSSGASLSGALDSVVEMITNFQSRSIKNYAGELNMWILLYLLLAAALPSLGIAFFVVLSSIAGGAIDSFILIMIVAFAFVMQIILIGFVKTRVPQVLA